MIETGIDITVYTDDDYHYTVSAASRALSVTYKEECGLTARLTFGSTEEMEAVARAMLKVASLSREQHD